MFWTAVVWGLGVSLGASVGMMTFVMLATGLRLLTMTKAAKTVAEINELSLAALNRRNELTEDQNAMLLRIAVCCEDHAQRDQGDL